MSLPGIKGRIINRLRHAPAPATTGRPKKATKAQLLAEAKRLGLKLPKRATATEIQQAIYKAGS